ncbi:hypothetical protein DICPUDRAFT_156411 [Dictyostelium purpureum]|uniref:Condensation domain-containing protein n=1 Tax=Dictyostelium purpureum TaxID=5786 RepID=F0ZWI1_DICPU|nr:uncharacterized protein DICPUDRAFT_156411 [Dictyostelium purpureum]EGC31711.1 hypothetical protein DICPUDRAFT_156411 [Dictyostelium purpureum]|eukprot:XP_003291777.1 hypothetical protein DICPUDRAFT_156411 [Dictyostelium purpureum]
MGSINVEKFIEAMDESFKDYQVLLSYIYKESEKPFIFFKAAGYEEILEIEERNGDSINNCKIEDSLPNKIKTRDTENGVKVGVFKLTLFKDGFSLGNVISHAIFDQGAVCYYFKYVSQLYNNGRGRTILAKPHFTDYSAFSSESIIFNDMNEAQLYANQIGFSYPSLHAISATHPIPLVYNIEFNINELENFKSSIDGKQAGISKNDIITAVFFKMFASQLLDSDIFSLKYACNIRKTAGLGEEALGNIYIHCCIPLKVLEIKEKSLLELAKISRKSVSKISVDHFKKDLIWYKYIQDNKIDSDGYFFPTPYTTILSNWNQFDYSQVRFNDSTPYALRTISIASKGTNFISFDINNDNKKIISTTIAVTFDNIDAITEMGNNTNLFKIIK